MRTVLRTANLRSGGLRTWRWALAAGLALGLSLTSAVAVGQEEAPRVEAQGMRVDHRDDDGWGWGGGWTVYRGVGGAWRAMLRFDESATYTYELTRYGQGPSARGTLTLRVEADAVRKRGDRIPDSLSFTFELNGRRDGFTVRDPVASPGETLMARLLTSGRWDLEDVRLLWTPFVFTRWAAELERLPWRTGPVWSIRGGDSETFRIDSFMRRSEGTRIRGYLERNGRRVLELTIDPELPLPEYIRWTDEQGRRYEAELVSRREAPSRPRM